MPDNLTEQELLKEVQRVICSVFRVDEANVGPDTSLVSDLGAESIDFLDLGFDLEKIVNEELNFRQLFEEKKAQTPEAAPDLTVREIVDYLQARLRTKLEIEA